MTHIELLWTIGSIGSIIALSIAVFTWFNISPQQLAHFFITRRRTIYITLISAFTIFYISLFTYITVVLRMFNFQWSLLWIIVVFSTVGLWSPVLMSERVWSGRFRRVVNWAILAFSIIILVGFWIISWPTHLLTPSILTGVVVITLIASYLYEHWSRIKVRSMQWWDNIKTKTMQCWDDVNIKTMQYWHRIGTKIRKRPSS
jgi:hypothetical protein